MRTCEPYTPCWTRREKPALGRRRAQQEERGNLQQGVRAVRSASLPGPDTTQENVADERQRDGSAVDVVSVCAAQRGGDLRALRVLVLAAIVLFLVSGLARQ